MNILTFLQPKIGTPTKTYIYKDEQWILQKDYQMGKFFQGHISLVKNLPEAFEAIEKYSQQSCFYICGKIIDGTNTNNMVRRYRNKNDGINPTITDNQSHLICFDIDGFETNQFNVLAIEQFIKMQLPKPFHQCSYIYQYSASYQLTTNKLKCHLWFWLHKSYSNQIFKQAVKHLNISCLDTSIYQAQQPIYIQPRQCLNAPDPIQQHIKYNNKAYNEVIWDLDSFPIFNSNTKQYKTEKKFNLTESIADIMTEHDYHHSLNRTALALAQQKMPKNAIKELLKALMNNIQNKDNRWQLRYNDIDRAVDSAIEIINQPILEDILEWLNESTLSNIKSQFAIKCLSLPPIDLNIAISEIIKKTGFGRREIQQTLKLAKIEIEQKNSQEAREQIIKERKKRGIVELVCDHTNYGDCARLTCEKLAQSNNKPEIFVIGKALASIIFSQPKTIQQCAKLTELGVDYPKMPIISLYRKPYYPLAGRIEQDVIFQSLKKKDIPCPTPILHIIGEAEHPDFKPLTGVVEHPFINNDWELVQKTGYNEHTGLYTVLHNKLKITHMNAKEAFKYLKEIVFAEFPFTTELDVAVAIATMMTAIQRPTIAGDTGLPGFGIVSPTQSSGKTTMAQLISYSIYNRPVAAQNWTSDEEELGKHLLAIFQEGHSCVLFDNIPQGATVQSAKLANAMSTDMFGGRQLGENKIIQVPSSVLWLFTGNGISFVGDFATRIYPININPKMEHPDQRCFSRENIGSWAMDNRKTIISAILSIIHSGKNAPKMKTATRFKEWDKFVRMPLYQVCGIDVNEAIERNQREDLIKLSKIQLLTQLHENFQYDHFTTKDIMSAAFGAFESSETDLGDAIRDVLGNKYKNSMSLGRFLGSMADSVFGNLILTKIMSNVIKWQIQKI